MTPTTARILLVDDLPANLHTLSRTLSADYDLSVATSGEDALALARQIMPDLILLDVMMPGIDGLETLDRLRASDWGKDIPVILVTADDRTETQIKGLDQGADDFIAKPLVVAVVQARVRNLLERQRLKRELFRLATIDELTGAHNRRYFFERAETERARALRHGYPCGLLMLDLDHFKSINDRHGHAVGDRVLTAFAEAVTAQLRDSDILGRIGGEEFAALLPHSERDGTRGLAERLRAAVATMQVPTEGEGPGGNAAPHAITVSIGATQLDPADTRFDNALQRADAALYAAKKAGRNRVCDAP